MEFPIEHEAFIGDRLAVRSGSMWKGPRLLERGRELRGRFGKYQIKDSEGRDRLVRLHYNPLDAVPGVSIDGVKLPKSDQLRWFEYAWIGLPLLLIMVGGAIGGASGFAAGHINGKIFRSSRAPWLRYALTGLVSLGSVVGWVVLGALLQGALGR